MNKKFVFIILLFSTGLVATNDKTKTQNNTGHTYNWSSCPRSISPCCSPESSDDELELSDSESSASEYSDDEDELLTEAKTALSWSAMAKPFIERFGGYFFGGALAVLITYKFYRAGYV